jgi:hypothetical protein
MATCHSRGEAKLSKLRARYSQAGSRSCRHRESAPQERRQLSQTSAESEPLAAPGRGAADRLHAGLGEAEMLHLAFLDQVLDRAGDIFGSPPPPNFGARPVTSIRNVPSRTGAAGSRLASGA